MILFTYRMLLILIIVCCSSCDYPRRASAHPLEGCNFLWSGGQPEIPYNLRVEGFTHEISKQDILAIGVCKIQLRPIACSRYYFIILNCSKNTGFSYYVNNGVVLTFESAAQLFKEKIIEYGILNPEHFKSCRITDGMLQFVYDGNLLKYQEMGDYGSKRSYVRFDIAFQDNPGKIKEYIEMIFPGQKIDNLSNVPSLIINKFESGQVNGTGSDRVK